MARIVIYSSLNIATVQLVRATLTQEGIVSYMGSVHLAPLGGEVPFDDARIELFVEEEDEARALAIINAQTGPQGADRICSSCEASNPSNFEVCWRCQSPLGPSRPTLV